MVVSILPNLDKNGSHVMLEKLGKLLKENNIEAFIPEYICGTDFKSLPEEQLFKVADVIITIGGDGTIMRYAKSAALEGKPILGINAGRMGYLASIEQNELGLISKLFTGNYITENRMMLSVKVYENGSLFRECSALNDAVITSGSIARIIDISLGVAADRILYRADGLIVSTPTGSTAYSMSAGGPVIDPLTEGFCITPICSHSLSAKPILLGAEKTISLKAFSKKRAEIILSVDGRKIASVKPSTEIVIKRSEFSAKLIRLNDRSFFRTLSYKFNDARGI